MNAKALAPLVAVYLAVCRAAEFTARAPSSGKGIEGAREGTLHNGVGEQGTLPQGAQEQSGEGGVGNEPADRATGEVSRLEKAAGRFLNMGAIFAKAQASADGVEPEKVLAQMMEENFMVWGLAVDSERALHGAFSEAESRVLGQDDQLADPVARAQGLGAMLGLLAQAKEHCELVALAIRAGSYFWAKVEEYSLAKRDGSLYLAFGDPQAAKQSMTGASETSKDLQANIESIIAELLFMTELLENEHMPSLSEKEEPEGAAGFAGEGRRAATTVLRIIPICAKYVASIQKIVVQRAGSKGPVKEYGLDMLRDAVGKFVTSEEDICVNGLYAALPQFQEYLAKELGCDKASLNGSLAGLQEEDENMTEIAVTLKALRGFLHTAERIYRKALEAVEPLRSRPETLAVGEPILERLGATHLWLATERASLDAATPAFLASL